MKKVKVNWVAFCGALSMSLAFASGVVYENTKNLTLGRAGASLLLLAAGAALIWAVELASRR